MRLRDDPYQSIDGEHQDRKHADIPGGDHGEHCGIESFPHTGESAYTREPQRNQQERQADDEEALDEVGVGRRDHPPTKL